MDKGAAERIGLVECKPVVAIGKHGLSYKLSAPNGNGTDWGDACQIGGSQGFFMSARQLSAYLNGLTRSEAVLPKKLADQMRSDFLGFLGSDETKTKFGQLRRWWHGGYYPASGNPGELNSVVLVFSNGFAVSFIMNSDLPAGMSYGNILTNGLGCMPLTKLAWA